MTGGLGCRNSSRASAIRCLAMVTESIDVELKGKTKGGVLDYKIKSDIDPDRIVNHGICT